MKKLISLVVLMGAVQTSAQPVDWLHPKFSLVRSDGGIFSSLSYGTAQGTSQTVGYIDAGTICINGKSYACLTENGANGILTGGAISLGTGATGISIRNGTGVLSIGSAGSETFGVSNAGSATSMIGSGSNAFAAGVNGARIDFGAGASDYASSDGTTVTFAGPLSSGSGTNIFAGTIQSGGAFTSTNANSTCFSCTSSTSISTLASSIGTAASGTGITANYSGAVREFAHKVTVTNAALAAASTSDVTLAVTPTNTRITRVLAEVTQVFTGGSLSAVTVTCGNAAGGNQYLLSGSVFTATTTLGDQQSELGTNVLGGTSFAGDMGTVSAGVPSAVTVSCRFTCTGANCSAATQGSVTFYVEGTAY